MLSSGNAPLDAAELRFRDSRGAHISVFGASTPPAPAAQSVA